MAAPHILKKIRKIGPLEQVIPQAINETGSLTGAAKRLGTSIPTLSKWLKDNHYHIRIVCEPRPQA